MTTIGCYAYRDCAALTHVTLGEQLTNWTEDWGHNGAFENCTSLNTLLVENGVNSIGAYSFYGCTSLESVEVPNTSICVGEYAFANCSSLKEAIVYRGIIENNAFENCTALESISIRKVTDIGNSAFRNCPMLSGVELPRTLISLGSNSFRDCIALTEIVVPDSTTSFGAYAFYGCAGITNAYISNNINEWITDWGNNEGFGGCTNLEYVYFGDGLTSISEGVLANCTSLKGVYLPQSITSIGENMLENVSSDCIIYGQKGSYAETYAESLNIAFDSNSFPLEY